MLTKTMTVPLIVRAGPFAEMVVPAMEKAEGFGVKVWPATASIVVEDGDVREKVLLPKARTPE